MTATVSWAGLLTVRMCALQSAVADRNVSETVYMAESLYLRYDIPFIMQPVLQALTGRGVNISAINSTHVLFTVCCFMSLLDSMPFRAVPCRIRRSLASVRAGALLHLLLTSCKTRSARSTTWPPTLALLESVSMPVSLRPALPR